ncbi:MAG: acetate uptake transporter [Propionibacteriaceae bacterium]|jgi:succinate-acetate transporter protein|nr:acetate uptake transporter [Propionibacteriaceae bacterium]
MSEKTVVTEMKMRMSDPTALGVFGLAMVTFVASSQKLGWTTGVEHIIPWAMMLGSIAQIWAAKVDFKNNNYFGSIVLGAYGLFWMAVSINWMITLGWFGMTKGDTTQVAFGFLGYFIFSLFITVAAFEVSKVFAAILVLIDVLLLSLGLAALGVAEIFSHIAAWSEFAIALLSFYACGGIFLNNFFGKKVLPMGKPFGFIKKG